METKEIKITLETARRMYEQGGEFREMALGAFTYKELIGGRLPKTWEEYCIMKGDEGEKINAALNFAYVSVRKSFTDYHDAEKHIAQMKLHLLRDEYRNGWLPYFGDISKKYGIIRNMIAGKTWLVIAQQTYYSDFLSFPTYKLADEFLTNFRNLIKEAGDLI